MNKRHLVIGNWIDKKTGDPKTNLAPINEGVSKESGNSYQITETDNTTIIDGTYPVGSILQSTTTFIADDVPPVGKVPSIPKPPAPAPAPQPKSTKS